MLCRCRQSGLSVEAYCELLGIKDIDSLDALPPLPPAVVALTAANSVCMQQPHVAPLAAPRRAVLSVESILVSEGSDMAGPLKVMELSLLNSMDALSCDNRVHVASVLHGWHRCTSDSLAACVSALGGPAVLFPLLHAASSEAQLSQTLLLLKACARRSPANLRFLQTQGYEVAAFLLSKKPRETLTAQALEVLFDLCVEYRSATGGEDEDEDGGGGAGAAPADASQPQGAGASRSGLLLVDHDALRQLVLNHQVWHIRRFSYAKQVRCAPAAVLFAVLFNPQP